MMKRILSVLIVLCMLVVVLPATAFAETVTGAYTMNFTSTEAVPWAGGMAPATQDCSGTGWGWVASSKTLTLSGFGFTCTTQDPNSPVKAIILPEGATLHLTDGTTNTIELNRNTSHASGSGVICVANNGALNITGNGTLTLFGCYGILATISIPSGNSPTININNLDTIEGYEIYGGVYSIAGMAGGSITAKSKHFGIEGNISNVSGGKISLSASTAQSMGVNGNISNVTGGVIIISAPSGTYAVNGNITGISGGCIYLRGGSKAIKEGSEFTGDSNPLPANAVVKAADYGLIFSDYNSSERNSYGSLILYYMPGITAPANQRVTVGQTATFSVSATASSDYTPAYQWQVSTDSGTTWNNVTDGTGGTTATYTTAATTVGDNNKQYRCHVYDPTTGSISYYLATSPSIAQIVNCFANDSSAATLTVTPTGTISGMVKDNGTNTGILGATVKLMRGDSQVGTDVTTDSSGNYSFGTVEYGVYRIVIIINNEKTITVPLVLRSTSVSMELGIPVGRMVNTEVDVTSSSVPNTAANLVFAAADEDVPDSDVTLKLTVSEANDTAGKNAIKSLTRNFSADYLFLDFTVTKTINNGTPETLTSLSNLVTIYIEVPEAYRSASLRIFRMHGGTAQEIGRTPNSDDEYFELNEDYSIATLYVKNFSTYALSNAVTQPITPTPSPANRANPSTGASYTTPLVTFIVLSAIGAAGIITLRLRDRREDR